MIKAVFFDLYHTLVHYEPPREELLAKALNELGVDLKPADLSRPLVIADEFLYAEHARLPIGKRSPKETMALYSRHAEIMLKEAGREVSPQLIGDLTAKFRHFKLQMVLFDDVIGALTDLKGRGLTLGLLSNVDKDISPLCQKLGLAPLLPIVVTSQNTGFYKPGPEIFAEALLRAGVPATEALYVGDQYQVDVIGASKAGMKGIFLDRGGHFEQTYDCPRIRNLNQIVEHLE
ncbi:MAG: HAD family hydrolase [Chloroflexota bacterium]